MQFPKKNVLMSFLPLMLFLPAVFVDLFCRQQQQQQQQMFL